jgi:hypothetical protein
MAAGGGVLARALSDGADRLLEADEPLAGLQLRCGGELPGTIAVPALLETVRKARNFGFKLARPIAAQDGTSAITAWVEVEPREGDQPGCTIVLRNWRATPLPPEDPETSVARRVEIDRTLAEVTARLDAKQGVLTADGDAPDVRDLVAAMRASPLTPWTEFVEIQGNGHRQPLHWRLLDGATVAIAGSERGWRATLVPIEVAGADPTGFELYLTADTALLGPRAAPKAAARGKPAQRIVGRDLAPVLRQPISRIIANAETIRTRMAGPLAEEYSAYAADIAAAGQH